MHTYDDNSDMERVEFDFSRATRAKGPRFPEGFEIRIDDATGYSLRLIPSNKILGRFASTHEAWPAVIAAIEAGRSPRMLVLDWLGADGSRGPVSSGITLEYLARSGLGLPAEYLRSPDQRH
jgi:hypothetical protein